MARFTCSGFQPVDADSASEAAGIFANRMARREYGRKGYCRLIRLDSWTENGRDHTFKAFVGRDVGNACSGRDVWLHVHRGVV